MRSLERELVFVLLGVAISPWEPVWEAGCHLVLSRRSGPNLFSLGRNLVVQRQNPEKLFRSPWLLVVLGSPLLPAVRDSLQLLADLDSPWLLDMPDLTLVAP